MTMLRRLLRILLRFVSVLLALAMLLCVTIFIYYRMTARDPAAFIPAGSTIVLSCRDLSRTDIRILQADFPALQAAGDRFRGLTAAISSAFRVQPALFRKLSPLLTSGCQYSMEKNGAALITFDLGWKSFFFSAGSFVVRTTWSDNPDILFTAEEFDLAGEDTTIYRIELLRLQSRLYLAIKKNILLIADEGSTIRRALAADIRKHGLAADPSFRAVATTPARDETAVMLPGLPPWLLAALPAGFGNFTGWTGTRLRRDGSLSGRAAFRADTVPAALARILRSNRYRPDAYPWTRAAGRFRMQVLLYDALEELLTPGSDAVSRDWKKSGNEAGMIRLPEGRLLYQNTLGTGAAADMVREAAGRREVTALVAYPLRKNRALLPPGRLFGLPAPRFIAFRERTVLAAVDKKTITTFLQDAGEVPPAPSAPAANGILAAPGAGWLVHYSHTDGMLRYHRELMRKAR